MSRHRSWLLSTIPVNLLILDALNKPLPGTDSDDDKVSRSKKYEGKEIERLREEQEDERNELQERNQEEPVKNGELNGKLEEKS